MINDDSDGYFSDFHCSPNSDIYAGNCKIEPMSNDPFIQILEQPGDFRYRYEKERYHGYILGQSSPPTKRKDLSKYPSVKICNYDSDVIIRCWLISADINESSKAHFHKLARKLPKGEMKLEPHESRASRKNGYEVTFDYMYIVHAVEKEQKDLDIYENKKRWLESSSYDPPPKSSNAEIDRVELKNLDKNQSILLFEAFDAETKEKICESSISRKIKNLHNPETASLKIVNYSKTSGSPRGGDEVFMFFEKISKDVEIKFFSDYSGGRWEAKALYNNQNIHHQCAIVFKTPPFYDQNISSPTPVFIELFRKTDGAKSEPVPFTYQPDAYCSYNNFARKRPHSPEPVISDSKDDPLISLGASPKRNKEHFDHGQMPEILSPQTIEELFLSYEIDTLNDSETIPCKVEHTGWHTELETIPESKDILSNMTWIGEDNKPLQDVQLDYLDYLPHFTLFSNSQIQSDSAIKIVQANSSEDEEDVTEKVKIKSKTTKNSDRNTKLGNDKNSQEDDDKVDSGVKKVSKKPQAGMGIREMGIRSSPRKNVLKSAMKEVNLCNNLLADVKIQTDYVTSYNLSDDENRVIPQVADHIAEAQGPEFSLYSPPEFKVMRINKNQPIEDCDELPVINPVSPTDWERLPSKVNNTAPLGIPEDIRILKFLCSYITDETSDKLSTLEFILWKKRNFDINTADFGGNSLFLIACSRSIRIASFLLRYIEEVNLQMTNLDGDNALLCASRAGRLDIVELLLHNRFDANVHNYKSGDTPLHIAVDSENIPLIKLLIKHGGNPLMNNFASESPYDYSTLSQNNGLKKYLYLKAQERFGKRRIRPTSDYFSCENINSQMQCLKPPNKLKKFSELPPAVGSSGGEMARVHGVNLLRSIDPSDPDLAEIFVEDPLFCIFKQCFSTKASFTTKGFHLHKLEKGPSTEVTLNKEDALTYYKQMHTIRRLETAAGNLYKEKLVRGFCHLYSGQEACAVGMKASMRPMDSVISAYRVHGWTYLMGLSVFDVLSELAGKKTGTSRGKGGSMHMYGRNFYGGNGIVGAQVPIGAGVALAAQYLKTGGVCFTLYGDGAANQGQVFEAFNIAKLWNLPCIFVCENNGYAMGTSVERSTASTEYYTRGDYVPGIRVDGMDVLAVREASKFAIDYAVKRGPILLELVTYRYSGHSMSDPGTSYRTRDEVQVIRHSKDPISSFRERITSTNLASEEDLKIIDSAVKKAIDSAVLQAKAEKEIGMEELTGDVYVNCVEKSIRNITPWDSLKHKNISQNTH